MTSAIVVPNTAVQQAFSNVSGFKTANARANTPISITCSRSCSTDVCIVCRLATKYPLIQADTAMNGRLGARNLNEIAVLLSFKKYSAVKSDVKNIALPKTIPKKSDIIMHFSTEYFALPYSPLAVKSENNLVAVSEIPVVDIAA